MTVRVDNPFRKFRQELGISQTEFGLRAGVSKHAILRLEQGMYDSPLPSVVEYVIDNSDISQVSLLDDYAEFQKANREDHGKFLGPDLSVLSHRPVGKHPSTFLRQNRNLNQTQFAKCLCISQTIISNWETNPVTQHTVPDQVLRALSDCGYDDASLDTLKYHYTEYREYLNQFKKVRLIS